MHVTHVHIPCHLGNRNLSLRADLVYAVFLCVQVMVGLLMLEIFNRHTDVYACHFTWGIEEH